MIVEQATAQLGRQLTSIDPLVQLVQAAANDHLHRKERNGSASERSAEKVIKETGVKNLL